MATSQPAPDVPRGVARLRAATETFAWNTTMIFVGAALGTAVAGSLIAVGGYRAAIALAAACALSGGLFIAAHARNGRLAG